MSWLAGFIKQLKKFRIFFLEKRAVKVVRYSITKTLLKNPEQNRVTIFTLRSRKLINEIKKTFRMT
jgi:hypothetical protein